ncbi:uncharacterized protein BDW47DRAFT_90295 [Aspergillus candidus]|uniref:Uncharacterized protein n=1 Tax=Aspergillus candidus TaxID=41067 RepID=A0A2I2EZ75_ASPCN|nr:hypothetical protein BDW47DRAFT_90295 [Aspergillus candidus]PLB33672.1 hypothetical protein BDW47DRAFT_90295 [Aspergillus candidus]
MFSSQLYRLLGEERRRDVWRTLGAAGRKKRTGRNAPQNNKITGVISLLSLFYHICCWCGPVYLNERILHLP